MRQTSSCREAWARLAPSNQPMQRTALRAAADRHPRWARRDVQISRRGGLVQLGVAAVNEGGEAVSFPSIASLLHRA